MHEYDLSYLDVGYMRMKYKVTWETIWDIRSRWETIWDIRSR